MCTKIESLLESMKRYARENWIPVVFDETAQLLEQLVVVMKPKRILEIGTAIGYSSIIMARNLGEDCCIDTIEISPERIEMAWDNIHQVGFEKKIRIIEGDAGKVLPFLQYKYDLIFSDASKSQYIKILPDCIRLLSDSGILITDNMFYRGKVLQEEVAHKQRTAVVHIREYIDEVRNSKLLKSSLINIGDGVMISRKEKVK